MRQKTHHKWPLCQIVSTRILHKESKFQSSLEVRSLHVNSIAYPTFISIIFHNWRSPVVADSSCKTSSEQCCQSLVVSDPFIGLPSGASFQTVGLPPAGPRKRRTSKRCGVGNGSRRTDVTEIG